MTMKTPEDQKPEVETDERYPSGPWKGFYLQDGRHWMELDLTFTNGQIRGDGRDRVGRFLLRGRYETGSGKVWFSKRYFGAHDVAYQGYNEGKGIWGVWEIQSWEKGGFHIWPKAWGELSIDNLTAEQDTPVEPRVTTEVEEEAEVLVGVP